MKHPKERGGSHYEAASSGGAARAYLAAIVESSDDAIIGKTPQGIITSWNAGATRIYGYMPEEMIGRHIGVLAPPGHEDEMPRILERVGRDERVEHFETTRTRKDGTLLDISLTVSPIKDAKGRIIGASTIARDVTATKRASLYARSLIEASLDPLVTISPE
ncbi:MAG: PAS domain-containing protein, partial [Candidatus Geothermincolia bacterium]